MSAKIINVNDISYLQNNLIGLPFIITDDSAFLPSLLHDEVGRRWCGTKDQQLEMLRYIQQYVMDINNIHAAIARQYSRTIFDVQLTYFLMAPEVEDGITIQKFVAQFSIPIDDCVVKFTQRALKFSVNERRGKWKEIVLPGVPQVGEAKDDLKAMPVTYMAAPSRLSQ